MATLHLTGPVLIGPEEVRSEIWVVGGRVSFTPPMSGPVDTISGWVMPGLVDAHCHVGLGKEARPGRGNVTYPRCRVARGYPVGR